VGERHRRLLLGRGMRVETLGQKRATEVDTSFLYGQFAALELQSIVQWHVPEFVKRGTLALCTDWPEESINKGMWGNRGQLLQQTLTPPWHDRCAGHKHTKTNQLLMSKGRLIVRRRLVLNVLHCGLGWSAVL
jgi:hypothetical protein